MIIIFILSIILWMIPVDVFGTPVTSEDSYVIYMVDNSGSMGCKPYKSTPPVPGTYNDKTGECIGKNYPVEDVKTLIKKDLNNRFKKKDLDIYSAIYEIGGISKAGECNKKFMGFGKISIYAHHQLLLQIDDIKANASGATDIAGSISEVIRELVNLGAFPNSDKQIEVMLLTDGSPDCDGQPLNTKIPKIYDQLEQKYKVLITRSDVDTFFRKIKIFSKGQNKPCSPFHALVSLGAKCTPVRNYKHFLAHKLIPLLRNALISPIILLLTLIAINHIWPIVKSKNKAQKQ